jgi:SAM-dependent methyltransferase
MNTLGLVEPPSLKDLFWYANWRPRIWANVIKETFDRLGWENLNGKRVLEIGFHDGRMGALFVRYGADYLGYEITPGKDKLAYSTLQQKGFSQFPNFTIGDFMSLTETFDYVFVKSVLYHIEDERTYRRWLSKIDSLLAPGGKFIAIENGRGTWLNHWIRETCFHAFSQNLLFNSFVEKLFRESFSKVDIRYHYVLSHLTPWPRQLSKLESMLIKPNSSNCFIASLICEK